MADVLKFPDRSGSNSADVNGDRWRLVTISAADIGFTIEMWSGRPNEPATIRALIGQRLSWAEAMAFAHDKARELGIDEVFDWTGAPDDPGSAA